MSRAQIESAIESGKPFTIYMADGKSYEIRHRDYVSLAPNKTFVIVHEDDGHFHVLPMLTMTGLTAQEVDATA